MTYAPPPIDILGSGNLVPLLSTETASSPKGRKIGQDAPVEKNSEHSFAKKMEEVKKTDKKERDANASQDLHSEESKREEKVLLEPPEKTKKKPSLSLSAETSLKQEKQSDSWQSTEKLMDMPASPLQMMRSRSQNEEKSEDDFPHKGLTQNTTSKETTLADVLFERRNKKAGKGEGQVLSSSADQGSQDENNIKNQNEKSPTIQFLAKKQSPSSSTGKEAIGQEEGKTSETQAIPMHQSARIALWDQRSPSEKTDKKTVFRKLSLAREKKESGDAIRVVGEKSESSSGLNRFALAETDIELTSQGGGRKARNLVLAELADKLDTQAGNEIVRQVRMIINRAQAGEIRVNLHPDNLGKVRVLLKMDDNHLTGRIIVDSVHTREIFRHAIEGLESKLLENGFNSAQLDLTMENDSENSEQMKQKKNRIRASVVEAAREFDQMALRTLDQNSQGRINLIA